jgi:hypothetical protein
MRVSRYGLAILLYAVSAGVSAIWSGAANAEETPKPEEARTQGGAGADSKPTTGHVPKDILIVNPCKAAHPPSYCNVKN